MPQHSSPEPGSRWDVPTRTGAGTPMGDLLRRYWWPIAGASELEKPGTLAVRDFGLTDRGRRLARFGRSSQNVDFAFAMPFSETGRSPGTKTEVNRDFGRIVFLSGVCPRMGCSIMGSEGPVVQPDSACCSERRAVRPTEITADLNVPVVRAAVMGQAGLRPRARSATPPLRRLPDVRNRTYRQ
jgi:hypothetical protein